jgi:hypothetical protein
VALEVPELDDLLDLLLSDISRAVSKEEAPVVIMGTKVRSGVQNSEVAIERSRSELKQLAAGARPELKNRKVHAVMVKRTKRRHVNQNTRYSSG